jgi:hypothetical protein
MMRRRIKEGAMDRKPNLPTGVPSEQSSQNENDCVPIDSVTLDRLIEEVRSEDVSMSRHYNRTYNRHNR